MFILQATTYAKECSELTVSYSEDASVDSVEESSVHLEIREPTVPSDLHICVVDDDSKGVALPVAETALLRSGLPAAEMGALRAAAGVASLLGLTSVILAALEVDETVIYAHSYANGSYDEDFVQQLLIASLVESCAFLVVVTLSFGVLTMWPSTVVLCKLKRVLFLPVCVSAHILFAFTVYTVVLQILCATWDSARLLYVLQCVFSIIRGLLLCGLLTLFTQN